eukprot:3974940-Pleurochrysis_carterae.AAC.3
MHRCINDSFCIVPAPDSADARAHFTGLEYMDGGSLESQLKRTGNRGFPEPILSSIMFQMVQGLTYLHKEKHAVRATSRDPTPCRHALAIALFSPLPFAPLSLSFIVT